MRTSSNSSSSNLKPPWKVSSYNVPGAGKTTTNLPESNWEQLIVPSPSRKWKAKHPLHLLGNNSSVKQVETVLCPHGEKGMFLHFFFLFAAAYMSLKQASGWRKDTEVTDCTSWFCFFFLCGDLSQLSLLTSGT